MERRRCLLNEEKLCDDCGECARCDLDPSKLCDNCMKCVKSDADYLEIQIDEILDTDGEIYLPTQNAQDDDARDV